MHYCSVNRSLFEDEPSITCYDMLDNVSVVYNIGNYAIVVDKYIHTYNFIQERGLQLNLD